SVGCMGRVPLGEGGLDRGDCRGAACGISVDLIEQHNGVTRKCHCRLTGAGGREWLAGAQFVVGMIAPAPQLIQGVANSLKDHVRWKAKAQTHEAMRLLTGRNREPPAAQRLPCLEK